MRAWAAAGSGRVLEAATPGRGGSGCMDGTFPRKGRLCGGSGLLCDMGRFRGNAVSRNAISGNVVRGGPTGGDAVSGNVGLLRPEACRSGAFQRMRGWSVSAGTPSAGTPSAETPSGGTPPSAETPAMRRLRALMRHGTFPRKRRQGERRHQRKRRLCGGSGLLCDMGRFRGNVVRGNAVRGNVVRGNAVRGNAVRGNVVRGLSPPPSLDRLGAGCGCLCRRRRPGPPPSREGPSDLGANAGPPEVGRRPPIRSRSRQPLMTD